MFQPQICMFEDAPFPPLLECLEEVKKWVIIHVISWGIVLGFWLLALTNLMGQGFASTVLHF